jgi:7,8-dihydroneopterin aldolase/epimerase/oxygenase
MPAIQLNRLKFFAFHGIHPEEKVLGTEFEVNVIIQFERSAPIRSIEQTVDYTKVYEIIKKRMNTPTALLETVLEDLVEEISKLNNAINSISIDIAKINAPINNFSGKVGVSIVKNFE